ncbi:MAG: tail fiber domain-containing protein [Anaerolineales bacterium]|nr:tail fiber domain-containing protein [Anaerolineales bacterium]
MKNNKATRAWLITIVGLVALLVLQATSTVVAQGANPNDIVEVTIQSSSIMWTPLVGDIRGMTLTITGPDGFYFREEYAASARPTISSGNFGDGAYIYEVVLLPIDSQPATDDQSLRGLDSSLKNTMTQFGAFSVLGGAFVTPSTEGGVTPLDVVHADDVITTGSLCVGFDCLTDGTENFGFDTIRLKENNTRIAFDDTSLTAGFPANDWNIVANDSSSGGANYLAFADITGGKVPFMVMAGAPTNSLFVSGTGRLGVGTGVPTLTVHAVAGDSPGLRLEQNNTYGWTPQTWDIVGNESNFFIRDTTNGSKLPFRIQPSAPTNSLTIKSDGKVGVGTWSPAFDMEIERTGLNTSFGLQRTDGALLKLIASNSRGIVGTHNNYPLEFWVKNTPKMTLATSGALTVLGPVNATAFNVTSDRNVKENFAPIDRASVLERLSLMPISTWNFIESDNKVTHLGPMAQDFYAAFGLGMDEKHISTIDADGVAFAAIQELNAENTSLRVQIDDLTKRLSALESNRAALSAQSNPMIFAVVLLVCMNLVLIAALLWSTRKIRSV